MATKKLSPAEQELVTMAEQFARLGKAAGCTYEQMENFARAGVFLQKKQLEIAAICRLADKPDGPKKILVGGGRGGAKALALDTPILTNKGWSTMGELQVGDIVYDEQGKETTVLETSEIFHNHNCYEFEFDSGEKIIADEGHRWLTWTYESPTPKVRTSLELFNDIFNQHYISGSSPYSSDSIYNHKIVEIHRVNSVPTRCIAVDSPSHLFLAGRRFIPTHNTHCLLAQIFCDDCQRIKGLKALALRKVGRANKEQIADFRKKLLGNLQHTYREQAQTIDFANGSTVILGNFKDEKDIDKYLGLEYDLIYIMECNQLSQSKITNILSCLRTNKTDWRPRAYMDTNPGGISHASHKKEFVDPWKAGTEKETRYIHVTVDDNKFVDPDYKKFLETLVGWQRMAWLEGSWEFMAGSFFSNFDPNVHVYPNEVTDLNPRAITRWFAGLDYGFSHPTAFSLCCEDEGGNIFVVAEYGQSGTLIEQHAANIKDLLSLHGLIPEDLEFIAAGKDCFRTDKDGSTVATEYMEHGLMLTPTHIDRVNAWSQVAEVFGDPSKQIKPRCFIHKNCYNLITQIQMAQCDEKKPNDIAKMNADENGDGGDDYLENFRNAITMAYTSLLTSAQPIKMGNFQSISEKQTPDYIDVEAELIEAENSQCLIEDNRTFRL